MVEDYYDFGDPTKDGIFTEQQMRQRLMGEVDNNETDIRDSALKRQIKKGLDNLDLPRWIAPPPTPEGEKYRINDMAREHFSYINGLLDVSLVNETYERNEVLKMIEFHYQTAMIHGWKHAMELKGGDK